MTIKAVFFDRDDTLIEDKGYMYKTSDLKYFPKTIEVLKQLNAKGFEVFIVTNQSGVGRGFFSLDQMHKFNQFMLDDLNSKGIQVKGITFCPHSPEENCDCRKPKPKLINDLCDEFEVNKSASFMFGDKDSDLLAGQNAGLNSFKVHGRELENVLKLIASSKS